MAQIYRLVAHRQSLAELNGYSNFFERLFTYPIACVLKLLHLPLGGVSCDDPPVDRIADLEGSPEGLAPAICERIRPLAESLTELGFQPSICYAMSLPSMQTELYEVYFCRQDGRVVARITYRHWRAQGKHRLFTSFLSADRSGAALLTTNGRLDCLQPPEVHVQRQVDEPVPDLLHRHEEGLRQQQLAPLRLTNDHSIRQTVEQLHERFCQFQLDRGTYAPLRENSPTAVRLIQENTGDETAAELEWPEAATAGPLVRPSSMMLPDDGTAEIVRLMEEETTKKSSLTGNLMLFLVSLGAFVVVSKGQNDWSWTWLLIPVLLIHELGHLLAMRLCGYHNTKIFFIPFLGAAASGTNFNVPGWKRVLVSLAGPIPGLAVGILAGVAGMMHDQPLLTRFGVISCLLNGFNLLPVMPLDGGWVAFHLLFCRHPLLDSGFRACGAFALILNAILSKQVPLGILGFAILMGSLRAFKIGDVARRLRKEGVTLASEDSPQLDRELASRAVVGIRNAYANAPTMAKKLLATASLEVYSLLHSKPPGVLATLFFGTVQATALVVAIVSAILFMMGDKGHFGDILNAAARQPQHAYTCGSTAASGGENAKLAPPETVQIVAQCESEAVSRELFETLRQELADKGRVASIGPYLIVALPVNDEATREREIERLTARKVTFQVVLPDSGTPSMRITAVPRDAGEAASLVAELQAFSELGRLEGLLPPWSARWQAGGPEIDQYRKARASFAAIQGLGQRLNEDDQRKIDDWQTEVLTARRLGRRDEARKLEEQIAQLRDKTRVEAMEKRLADADENDDRECMEMVIAWQKETQQNWRERRRVEAKPPHRVDVFDPYQLESYRALHERLGRAAEDKLDDLRVTAKSLAVNQSDAVVEIHWLQFVDVAAGLPALLEWFCQRQCAPIKFEAQLGDQFRIVE